MAPGEGDSLKSGGEGVRVESDPWMLGSLVVSGFLQATGGLFPGAQHVDSGWGLSQMCQVTLSYASLSTTLDLF